MCPPPLRRPSDQTQREEFEEPHFDFSGVNDPLQSYYFPVHAGLLLWRGEGIRLVVSAWVCVGVCRCVRTGTLKYFMLKGYRKGYTPTGVIPKVGSVRLIFRSCLHFLLIPFYRNWLQFSQGRNGGRSHGKTR